MGSANAMLGSLCVGLAASVLSYSCRAEFGRAFALVENDLTKKLRRLRMSTRHLRRYLIIWLVVLACTFLGFWLYLENLVFGFLISFFLAVSPWYMVRRKAEKHREKIEDQLAESMMTLANAVKAGLSLAQALEILGSQCPAPINAEFQQMVSEYNMGKPLERTLTEAKERLESENFTLFAAAMQASHESGGRLNETVERIAKSVREMQRLERKVKSETAQARKSAVYMAMIPPVILIVYYFVDPINTSRLFTEVFGHVLLAIVTVLNVVAYLWARQILNPDI